MRNLIKTWVFVLFLESSPDKGGPKAVETDLHISEGNWDEELTSGPSSKENSVEKEVSIVAFGLSYLTELFF